MRGWSLELGKYWLLSILAGAQLPAYGSTTSIATRSLENQEAARLMEDAVVYAYPLVLMELTKELMTSVAHPTKGRAPINEFAHVRQLPDNAMSDIVSPNVDTLYSLAWLDLRQEPIILSVPDTNNRYYLMPIMDAWTNVFATIGKRTTGTKTGAYAIVGPGWAGDLPLDTEAIQAPTNTVWIVGRTQCDGAADTPAVNEIQDGFGLTKLSAWLAGGRPGRGNWPSSMVSLPDVPPVEALARMDAPAFLERLAKAIRANPPAASDATIVRRLEPLGIVVGHDFDPTALDADKWAAIEKGRQQGLASIDRAALSASGSENNGWVISYLLGSYGSRYLERAVAARMGLGASVAADTFYPYTEVDSHGVPLTGERAYVIHFTPGQTPPVYAFWSLTLYDSSHFFAPNRLSRYALGGRDALAYNADGSLDIYIASEVPPGTPESNWLPAPKANFNLILRAYWPSEAILEGRWLPPVVRPLL
ncbi:MAG: DUF1254 domain-containing protein [Deltaproteobacteria bacterium]|nr:DUF1254 domain-containing protein [Deltaproteobacteria bacterium]